MRSVRGVIDAVQEGRFRLVTEDGHVVPFVLSHKAGTEPQDLPQLRNGTHVRVDFEGGGHLVALLARHIEIEE